MNRARRALIERYHHLGFNLVPQHYPGGDKVPLTKWKSDPDWTLVRQTLDDLLQMESAWNRAQGVAAVCGEVSGGLRCVDFDKQPDRLAVDSFLTTLGLGPDYAWLVQTPGGGWHVWLRAPGLPDELGSRLDRPGITGGHIELRIEGVLTTLPPSRRETGRYHFVNGEPGQPPHLVGPKTLLAAYGAITLAPEPAPAPRRPSAYTPAEAESLWQQYCGEVGQAFAHAYHIERRRASSPWSKNFSSPFRSGDTNPSAGFNFDTCIAKDLGNGEVYTAHDIAALLGLPTWEQYKQEHLAAQTALLHKEGPLPPPVPRRFAKGMPWVLHSRLINLHKKVKGKFNSQAPAAMVLYAWNSSPMGEFLPQAEPFTRSEFRQASEDIGLGYTRRTVDTGLEQLLALGFLQKFCTKCDTTISNDSIDSPESDCDSHSKGAFCTNPQHQRRHAYRFLPIAEQVANFEERYSTLICQYAFEDTLADAMVVWGDDLSEDEVYLVDEALSPKYRDHGNQRMVASEWVNKQMAHLPESLERMLAGRYRPLQLDDQDMVSNSAAYRRAVRRARLREHGGQREKAYKAQYDLGVSRSSLPRIRAANQVISLEQTVRIPAQQVTVYQRTHNLLIQEHADGTATVRSASAEKFIDPNNPEEIAQYEAQLERLQRSKKAVVLDEPESGDELELPLNDEDPHRMPDTVPVGFSDEFLMKQLRYIPGAVLCDPETGEILPPRELLRLTVERLKQRQE